MEENGKSQKSILHGRKTAGAGRCPVTTGRCAFTKRIRQSGTAVLYRISHFGENRELYAENRMARAMYKLAVETSKLSHVIAYSHGVDEQALGKLQAKCAEEVKRINGAVRFEEAYEYQNRQ